MTRAQFKAQHRASRIAERRANKQARRENAWRVWAAGMTLLRSILLEEADKLQALAQADMRLARISPSWKED